MSKIYNAVMGLVIGDALGVPVEFKRRDSFTISGMTGNGTYNQVAGTWSDDSSMTLATIESLTRRGYIDPSDIMENFVRWYQGAEFTPWGKVFDIGNGTKAALDRYLQGRQLEDCGGKTRMDNGNGALMRILPLAFVKHTTGDIHNVCGLTHNHRTSKQCCEIYVEIAQRLYQGARKQDAVRDTVNVWLPAEEFKHLPILEALTRDEINSSGYVVDTLEAALWCFLTTHSYRECVLTAVNLGQDTDTVAAVTGGLAGLYYGTNDVEGIPQNWIDNIARRDWIKGLCDDFEIKFSKSQV